MRPNEFSKKFKILKKVLVRTIYQNTKISQKMDSPCSTKKKGPLIHQTPSQIKKRSSSSSSQETFPSPPPTSQTSSEICEREEMLNEIVSLERNYIRDLTVLIKVFRDPLKNQAFSRLEM